MKAQMVIFWLAGFAIFKAFLLSQSGVVFDFPEYNSPTVTFAEFRDSCDGIGDCLGWIADTLGNIGLGIVWFIRSLISAGAFALGIIGFMVELSVTGFDGLHPLINALVNLTMSVIIGLLIFSMVRGGRTSA